MISRTFHAARAARPSIPLAAALAVALAAVATARPTAAQDDSTERARAAADYDSGIAAFRTGDYAAAGQLFLRANRLAPSAIALAQAVRAFHMAGSVRVAGTLALRLLAQEGLPDVLREIAESAVADARDFYVRVDVDCSAPCTVAVNGVAEEGTRFFVAANQDVLLVATFRGGATVERTVRGGAGEAQLVSFAAPEGGAPASDGPPDDGAPIDPRALEAAALEDGENPYRISRYRIFSRPRATFFAVLAPTVIGTGMVTWSGIDTRRSREDLRGLPAGPERDLAQLEHDRNVRRTKWISVEVGAFVFATVMIAAFTDWTPHGDDDGAEATSASLDVVEGGAVLSVRRDF